MANITLQGFEAYEKQLREMHKSADGLIKRAVYDGAAVVVEEVEKAIESLPTHRVFYTKGMLYGVTREQKAGLLEGLGLSKMKNEDGFINTKLGFDGYNSVKTKKFPKGQPNALIARAVESGTSQRPKTRFVTNACKAAEDRAEKAMEARIDADLKNMEG